jgi:hypothetical protein
MLHFSEKEAWKKTPYQIITLFKYHKEYNRNIFAAEGGKRETETEQMDDIDIALGGL